MAKTLKSDGKKSKQANGEQPAAAPTARGANTDVRASIQRTAFRKLWDLDREIKAAIAKEVTPLREERSEIWKMLRNDLDAKAADLSPLYALYKRDRELAEIDDEEEAQKSQDMLREGWKTLQQGETLNFLTVLGTERSGEAEHVNTKTARAAGREAGRAGKNADHNPHAKGSDLGAAWEEGRGDGMIENVRTDGGKSATAH